MRAFGDSREMWIDHVVYCSMERQDREFWRESKDAENPVSLQFPPNLSTFLADMSALLYVIGLDGGGTKTSAELCTPDGKVLATSQGGPSNFQVIGVEQAARTILDLVETCCHSIGCTTSQIGCVVAGLTGAGRAGDQARMCDELKREADRRGAGIGHFVVESDARIALEGALGGAPGIIVIAGTGSIVFGKDRSGTVHRAGGWGRMIGDEGSGYALGRELFRAVAAAWDGRAPKTRMSGLLERKAGLSTQEAIISALYKEGFDIASVAPLVVDAAQAGDKAARRIVSEAAEELIDVISAVARKMKGRSRIRMKIPVVFIGSVMSSNNVFSKTVTAMLRKREPSLALQHAVAPPVHGASIMAGARLHRKL